jgi:LPXTG-motif cell wall-anchored protein
MPAMAQSEHPVCPAGTEAVAKWERLGNTDEYKAEYGGDIVTVLNTSTKTTVHWTSTVLISHIGVKGGSDSVVEAVVPPAMAGTVTNEGLPPVGQGQDGAGNIPDISYVLFCKGTTTDTSNGNGDNGNGSVPVIVIVPDPTTTTTTRAPIPFDEEPATVPPTVLPTIVEPTTTTLAPATVAPATEAPATTEAEVLGVTVDRQLPRTGAASTALAQIGFGLLLVGAGLLAHSRRVAYDER